MRLGEILLGRNLVQLSDIHDALGLQRRSGGHLSEILVESGLLTAEQLQTAVDATPPLPRTLADTGIAQPQLLNLLLKFMFLGSCESLLDLTEAMRLPYPIISELMNEASHRQWVEALGTSMVGQFSDIRYTLSQEGRTVATSAETRNLYMGPAPVSLAAFQAQIVKQRITDEFIDADRLRQGLEGLVFPERYIRKLLPAINAGQTVLLYGPPGNGKTTVAKRTAGLFRDIVYIPYAVEIAGQIMKVFDQALHQPAVSAEDKAGFDSREIGTEAFDDRWVACRRPFATAGGELMLTMLDLQYDTEAKFYDAPLHVKALNGTFLIDDFGRQRLGPKELLNRLILPMENRVDFLRLHTGKSFELPFDELLIFSTNLEPNDVMDAALLRRTPYKIKFLAPNRDEYRRLFDMEAKSHGLALSDDVFTFVVEALVVRNKFGLAYFQPKFICDQVVQICQSFALEPRLTQELAAEALANLYVDFEKEKNGTDGD